MDLFKDLILNDTLSKEEMCNAFKAFLEKGREERKRIIKGDMEEELIKSDMEMCKNECNAFFTPPIWIKLEEKSRQDLALAFYYSKIKEMVEDDSSTPIIKLTKTVENEIKIKLFMPYLERYTSHIYPNSNMTNRLVNRCIDHMLEGKYTLTLGQMLTIIKESSLEAHIEYALNLYNHIMESPRWDDSLFYSKGDENYYISYPDEYRNSAAHGYVFDLALVEECKIKTKEIVMWFIGAFIS